MNRQVGQVEYPGVASRLQAMHLVESTYNHAFFVYLDDIHGMIHRRGMYRVPYRLRCSNCRDIFLYTYHYLNVFFS
jgi:hypothetical protein